MAKVIKNNNNKSQVQLNCQSLFLRQQTGLKHLQKAQQIRANLISGKMLFQRASLNRPKLEHAPPATPVEAGKDNFENGGSPNILILYYESLSTVHDNQQLQLYLEAYYEPVQLVKQNYNI